MTRLQYYGFPTHINNRRVRPDEVTTEELVSFWQACASYDAEMGLFVELEDDEC